jgi:hypothetical protein
MQLGGLISTGAQLLHLDGVDGAVGLFSLPHATASSITNRIEHRRGLSNFKMATFTIVVNHPLCALCAQLDKLSGTSSRPLRMRI